MCRSSPTQVPPVRLGPTAAFGSVRMKPALLAVIAYPLFGGSLNAVVLVACSGADTPPIESRTNREAMGKPVEQNPAPVSEAKGGETTTTVSETAPPEGAAAGPKNACQLFERCSQKCLKG